MALLDREADGARCQQVRERLASLPGTDVADLHLWRVWRAQCCCIISVVTHQLHSADSYRTVRAGLAELVHLNVEVNRCAKKVEVVQKL